MRILVRIMPLCIAILLVACSAAGVPFTSDPSQKVGYAVELMNMSRMIPAERLLREVHQISPADAGEYFSRGESHYFYALLLSDSDWMSAKVFSQLVESVGGVSKLPEAASHHNDLAESDYIVARDSFSKQGDYLGLSKVEWRLAVVYRRMDMWAKACASLDASLQYSEKAAENNQKMLPDVYGRYASYSQMVAAKKSDFQCNAAGADLLAKVRLAYKQVSNGQTEQATAMLLDTVRANVVKNNGVPMSYVYAALADIEKFVSAGSPQPFDGNHIAAEGNKYESIILGPSSPKALEYLVLAEAALKTVQDEAVDDQADSTISNMWFHLASIYGRVPDQQKTCDALNNSLRHHLAFAEKNPNARFNVLGRSGSSLDYQKFISIRKNWYKCPA
jgi:hypothetical protein